MTGLKRLYTRFRKRYYTEGKLPPATSLIFRFVEEGGQSLARYKGRPNVFRGASLLALTSRLKNGTYVMEFHVSLRAQPRLLSIMLMHEMSHMYNWRLDHGPGWDIEALRLGSLGAMQEFF